MELNLTLFVQIGNFTVAYLMLKKFLFVPLVTKIQEEDNKKAHLNIQVDKKREAIINKEQELKEQWIQVQANFARMAPNVQLPRYTCCQGDCVIPKKIDITNKQKACLQAELKKALSEKVTGVR